MDTDHQPTHFIGEAIDAHFDTPPVLEKKPGCPDAFTWRDAVYRIIEKLSEWHDYQRRGSKEHNMREEHLATASRRGSWGVGRDYFRVRVEDGRVFDLYYDRAPKGKKRKGSWFIYRELSS